MPGDPRLRASDADRDRVATLLREHHAQGRLTAEEFHERLDAAYAAKTLGDLDALLGDLPGIDLYRLPAAGLRAIPRGVGSSGAGTRGAPSSGPGRLVRRDGRHRDGGFPVKLDRAWTAWAVVTAVLVLATVPSMILSGAVVAPWWLLIVVIWAIVLARRPRRLGSLNRRAGRTVLPRITSPGAQAGQGTLAPSPDRNMIGWQGVALTGVSRRAGSRCAGRSSTLCCGPSADFPHGLRHGGACHQTRCIHQHCALISTVHSSALIRPVLIMPALIGPALIRPVQLSAC